MSNVHLHVVKNTSSKGLESTQRLQPRLVSGGRGEAYWKIYNIRGRAAEHGG